MKTKKPSRKHLALHRKPSAAKRPSKTLQRALHKRIVLHPVTLFFLLCFGVLMCSLTLYVSAASYTLHAVVPAPPVTTPATIDSPLDQAHLATQHLTVSGHCPSSTYVELMQNDVLHGVANCGSTDTTYTIETDLQTGANVLYVRVFNITDSEGPSSSPITIWYVPPTTPAPSSPTPSTTPAPATSSASLATPSSTATTASPSASGPLLVAEENFHYQVHTAGQTVSWTLALRSGFAPYKLHIDWGDNTSEVQTINGNNNFTINHTYHPDTSAIATYVVKVRAVDTTGTEALLQTVAIVRGQNSAAGTNGTNNSPSTGSGSVTPSVSDTAYRIKRWLWVLWPSYGIVVLMALSYWLGERQEAFTLLASHSRRRDSRK